MAENTDVNTGKLMGIMMPLIATASVAALVTLVLNKLCTLSSTNSKTMTLAGDVDRHPTKEETNMASNQNDGARTSASGAKDESAGQKGELKGSDTDASGATEDAKAAGAGATASNTKAGASDIETKGLKMMS